MQAPESLISKLLKIAIAFAASCFLIKLGVCYIIQVWPILAIFAVIAAIAAILYKLWKKRRDGEW